MLNKIIIRLVIIGSLFKFNPALNKNGVAWHRSYSVKSGIYNMSVETDGDKSGWQVLPAPHAQYAVN